MSKSRPKGSTAVMALRHEALDALDFFPTPPWATRALLQHVIPDACGTVWEPAAGERHMADVLDEHPLFPWVTATDVHDYGRLDAVGSFTGEGLDVIATPSPRPSWIITNPPFNLALDFAERALREAGAGVALLVRTAWIEGGERYERLFRDRPPAVVAQFVERVPMVKGRWDPDASTSTSYVWIVWQARSAGGTRLVWIPPGCRERLTRPGDRARFSRAPEPTLI